MKYMGSKNRIAKYILPIILKDRKPVQWYVEPFVGGANMIDKVEGNRIGADINPYLISYLDGISRRIYPPKKITEEYYLFVKADLDFDPYISGYVGFQFSFGSKWFGGYRRDKRGTKDCNKMRMDNEVLQSKNAYMSALRQGLLLEGVLFTCNDYFNLDIPENSIIYCDPPYEGTTSYRDKFDHDRFWDWARKMALMGHSVFISEYQAPYDFLCVWEAEINSGLNSKTAKKATEKLFIFNDLY